VKYKIYFQNHHTQMCEVSGAPALMCSTEILKIRICACLLCHVAYSTPVEREKSSNRGTEMEREREKEKVKERERETCM